MSGEAEEGGGTKKTKTANDDSCKNYWQLVRSNDRGIYPIKENESLTIGRNRDNDIITGPLYCSRQHCTISVDKNGKITLKDHVIILNL